eukprot:10788004-Ditylum_brightwellii.AAC.1
MQNYDIDKETLELNSMVPDREREEGSVKHDTGLATTTETSYIGSNVLNKVDTKDIPKLPANTSMKGEHIQQQSAL